MSFNRTNVLQLLSSFEFKPLFIEELGWNNPQNKQPVPLLVEGKHFSFTPLAEKTGFLALLYNTSPLPDYNLRRKLHHELVKRHHEHIAIYSDKSKGVQYWQWVKREPGKPIAFREHGFQKDVKVETLLQKLSSIYFDIAEEESLNVVTVAGRVRQGFDVDRVTKKFYDQFKTEHAAFLKFIQGIEAQASREWYASLMLNRLMFIYFVQKKGFLDGDEHYLRNRLKRMQELQGQNTFYSFYRFFLLKLFHDGLNSPARTPELEALLGKVPYLNGGLFELHALERDNPEIRIPDEVFERVFNFFDQWNWHLDERPLKSDKEINPDVLGYIFEKYINQKQMGAYYTKEDITEYISKNTIIPFLFDKAKDECEVAFEPNGAVWRLLRDDPDRYIYPAVRKGVELELPPEIEAGLADVSKRGEWNKAAKEEYALPTEIWREVVARRQRYAEIRAMLAGGEVCSINDLITYNLDIRQFAQDAIEGCEGVDLLRAFYKAISRVTVLDPTCGSGAFLFAALSILQPLYEACLQRMAGFVSDADRLNRPNEYQDFRKILREMEHHPNQPYFILKSIIINNLYGVDIMEEAVEIAKLRLFLKLAAQLESVGQIEPLPDIDFNIRAGNTLVGFATHAEVERAITSKMDFDNTLERIEQKAKEVERNFRIFRELQTRLKEVSGALAEGKRQLQAQLAELNEELNRYLASEYGIDRLNYTGKAFEAAFEKWQKSHQPFHWYVEFYGIMQEGGFDVIIGNPPYVEYAKRDSKTGLSLKDIYKISNYKTEDCGNLYAFVYERALSILTKVGKQGLIVPISLVCTQRMEPLQNLLLNEIDGSWHSIYAERPAKLFFGAEVLLAISILSKGKSTTAINWATGLRKWSSEERSILFNTTNYTWMRKRLRSYILPKLSSIVELSIIDKVWKSGDVLGQSFRNKTTTFLFYRIGGGRYWKIFTTFQPKFILNGKNTTSSRENYLYFSNKEERDMAVAILSSTLFYWYFIFTTNGRDLNPSDLRDFPLTISKLSKESQLKLMNLSHRLMEDYRLNKVEKNKTSTLTGQITYEEFYPRLSKPIIDKIDQVLAQHYGFTDEELDFIINYDIKYRMGKSSEEEGEE